MVRTPRASQSLEAIAIGREISVRTALSKALALPACAAMNVFTCLDDFLQGRTRRGNLRQQATFVDRHFQSGAKSRCHRAWASVLAVFFSRAYRRSRDREEEGRGHSKPYRPYSFLPLIQRCINSQITKQRGRLFYIRLWATSKADARCGPGGGPQQGLATAHDCRLVERGLQAGVRLTSRGGGTRPNLQIPDFDRLPFLLFHPQSTILETPSHDRRE